MAVNGTGDTGIPRRVDWRIVGRAALLAIAVTVPVSVMVRIARGDNESGARSSLWVIAVLALFAGFALAGNFAARRRPDAPLVHAAASAGVAFSGLVALTVARRLTAGEGISGALIITLGLLLQISVSVAMLGAYLGMRYRAKAAGDR
ncbi:MAG: hypothetical protein ABIS21_06145 [Acidimicrobiales bacterium]